MCFSLSFHLHFFPFDLVHPFLDSETVVFFVQKKSILEVFKARRDNRRSCSQLDILAFLSSRRADLCARALVTTVEGFNLEDHHPTLAKRWPKNAHGTRGQLLPWKTRPRRWRKVKKSHPGPHLRVRETIRPLAEAVVSGRPFSTRVEAGDRRSSPTENSWNESDLRRREPVEESLSQMRSCICADLMSPL